LVSRFVDLVRPSEFPSTPWKNGAGTTVELATGPLLGGTPLWRFSIATLADETTRFSSFPGMDRVFTVIGDAGVHLAFAAEILDARPGNPVAFSGADEPVCAPQAETRAFNVMVDSTRATADVTAHDLATGSFITDPREVTLVFVRTGRASAASIDATASQCLLVHGSSVRVSGSGAVLLARVDLKDGSMHGHRREHNRR